MKEERYVIGKLNIHDVPTYQIALPDTGVTEDIMAAEMFDEVDRAIVELYNARKTFVGEYKIFKVKLQINEIRINITELSDEPIPREPFGPRSKDLISPP